MAWPVCPECGGANLSRVDRACEIRPAETEVYRSYQCICGWSCWTVEKVISIRPATLYLRRKFALPTVQTLSTSGETRPQAEDMSEAYRKAKKV